jgi:hypothetical protein
MNNRNKSKNKFSTGKSSIPCRFFNTNRGCQFGNNCEFGHFAENSDNNFNDNNNVDGSDRYRKGGLNSVGGNRMGQRLGPGSHFISKSALYSPEIDE